MICINFALTTFLVECLGNGNSVFASYSLPYKHDFYMNNFKNLFLSVKHMTLPPGTDIMLTFMGLSTWAGLFTWL